MGVRDSDGLVLARGEREGGDVGDDHRHDDQRRHAGPGLRDQQRQDDRRQRQPQHRDHCGPDECAHGRRLGEAGEVGGQQAADQPEKARGKRGTAAGGSQRQGPGDSLAHEQQGEDPEGQGSGLLHDAGHGLLAREQHGVRGLPAELGEDDGDDAHEHGRRRDEHGCPPRHDIAHPP
jgi:hypothetical protein